MELVRLDRTAFGSINLHWHDLRHEYASRLVERGVPLSQVRDLLGHASIVTTERYDNQQLERLQAAGGKLESGKLFEPPVESETGFHISCSTGSTIETANSLKETSEGSNPVKDQSLEDWLGVRDAFWNWLIRERKASHSSQPPVPTIETHR